MQPVADELVDLTLGEAVDASIDSVGQQDYYHFSLAGDSQLCSNTFTRQHQLKSSPDQESAGALVSARNFADSNSADFTANPVLALGAGEYTLVVDGLNDVTGSYGFRLMDLAASTSIALGDTVTATV